MSKRIFSANGDAMAAESHVTRRVALGAFASASALAFPPISTIASEQADPIFAALERHKNAWATANALSPTVDDVVVKRKGREVSQADCDAYERASSSEARALDVLLATTPLTASGMRAAIEYLVSFDDGCLSDTARPLLVTFLKSPLLAL